MMAFMILAVTVLTALLLAVPILRLKTNYLERGMAEEAEFFKAARTLLDEDTTPMAVVDLMEFMAETIRDPHLPRHIALSALCGQFRRRMEAAVKAPPSELDEAIDQMRPQLRKITNEAIEAYIWATTFRSFCTGWLVRRTILTFFDDAAVDKKTAIIEEETKLNVWRSSHSAGLVAA